MRFYFQYLFFVIFPMIIMDHFNTIYNSLNDTAHLSFTIFIFNVTYEYIFIRKMNNTVKRVWSSFI